jgi:hypothetical protein
MLLLVAVLLCHGAYGAFHQVHQAHQLSGTALPTVQLHQSHAHPHGLGDRGHTCGASEGDLCDMAYAATLVLLSMGAILWLLSAAMMRVGAAAPLLPAWGFGSLGLHPVRGPTFLLLQVFRL